MTRKAAIVISETMLLAFGIVVSFIILSSMGSMIFKDQSTESEKASLSSIAKSIAQDIDNAAAEAGSVKVLYTLPKGLKVDVEVDYKTVTVKDDKTTGAAPFQALTHTRPYTIENPRYLCIVKNQDDMRISLSRDKCICDTHDDRCDPACILEDFCDPKCNADNVFDNVCDRRCSKQGDGICDADCFTNDKDKLIELYDCMGAYDEDTEGIKKLKNNDRICDGDTHNIEDKICDPDCLNNGTSIWITCDPDCNRYDQDPSGFTEDSYCDLDCGYTENGNIKELYTDGICDLDCAAKNGICDPDCGPTHDPDCSATVPSTFSKGVDGLLWVPISNMPDEITYAKSMGADMYSAITKAEHVSAIKNGGTDYYADGIAQAHSLGMKFIIKMTFFYWADDLNKRTFLETPAYQQQFKEDFVWFLERYPGLDGIELEEPTVVNGGAEARAFNNAFFSELQAEVVKHHPLDSDFTWGFNSQSNWDPNIWGQGIDLEYIIDNNLFNSYFIQNGVLTLGAFQGNINTWEERLPGRRMISHTYLEYTALQNSDECQVNPWNVPACFNQVFFDQLKWAKDNNHPVSVFCLYRMGFPSSMWPDDLTSGATAGDKVHTIWGDSSSTPTSDTTSPSIDITCPSNNQTYRNPTASISGTASDNAAVNKVEVKAGSSAWQTATGTTSWVISSLTLTNGSNTISARATDAAGNTKETSITVNHDPSASSTANTYYDVDFDTNSVGRLECQGCTFTIVDNPKKDVIDSSDKVMKCQVLPGGKRAEFTTPSRIPTDEKKYRYSWMYYIPPDFKEDGLDWVTLSQWKTWPCEVCTNYADEICYGCGGIFNEVKGEDGLFDFRWRAEPDCHTHEIPLILDRWVRFEMDIYWTNTQNGYAKLWMDGTLIKELNNIKTLFDNFPADGSCDINWAVGLYGRNTRNYPADVYIDNLLITDEGFASDPVCTAPA